MIKWQKMYIGGVSHGFGKGIAGVSGVLSVSERVKCKDDKSIPNRPAAVF